jgi:hypothetical protein
MSTAAERPILKQLKCPQCGSALSQFAADAQTIICPSCGSFVALDMDGPTVTGQGRKLPMPKVPIAIGDTAQIQDTNFFVLGRVLYKGWDDEDKWLWDEWLMGGADGRLLWLSYSEDEEGFTLFRKLRVREPFDAKTSVSLPTGGEGQVRVHERYPAQIMGAEGELTWRGKPGDELFMAEAFGGGKRYSVQQTTDEMEIHEGIPLTQEQVANAFNKPQWLESLKQSANRGKTFTIVGMLFIAFALLGFGAGVWSSTTGERVLTQAFTLTRANPTATIPIEFNQIGRAAIVSVSAQGSLPLPSEIDIDVSIASPDETENELFTLELWRESGTDDEGYWEEAQASASDMFVPFQTGTHNLEVAMGEGTIDNINVEVNVRRNHILPMWFVIYGAVIGIVGIIILFMRFRTRSN